MTASVILLLSMAVTALLRRRSAALRQWVLAAAIACAALAPALERVVPAWPAPLRVTVRDVPLIGVAGAPAAPGRSAAALTPRSIEQSRSSVGAVPANPLRTGRIISIVWLAGLVAALGVLCIGLARLMWIARHAAPADARWIALLDDLRAQSGVLRRVSLLQSDHPSLLVTWGRARPRILLPAPAAAWSDAVMRTVLSHELAHIERADWIVQVAASLVRALYWFNPIVWVACRWMRLESEYACDALVMSRGVSGPEYAAQVLDLARALNARRTWLAAPAMARPSSLERRIRVMLSEQIDRRTISRSTRGGVAVGLLLVTGLLASAQALGTLTGSVVDPLGAPVPDVRLVMTNVRTDEKREVRSSRTGGYEFVSLPSAEYQLDASIPGFATSRQRVTIAGETVQRHIALQLGSLHETITVTDGPEEARAPAQALLPRPNPPCGADSGASAATGGSVRPPHKVRHVAPEFPPHLRGTDAVVIMDGRIALDGFVRDLQVKSAAHPDFVKAAADAVGQWQFDSTLLNCVPMEVSIGITVNFVHQP
jgi:beta-lactamase regulating signal transducer with metallopeptidase domain